MSGAALTQRPDDAVAEAEAMADAYLAKQEEVERIRKIVRWLDDAVRVPGTKFGIGLDALLGFILPGVGDAITGAVSLTVLTAAARRGVPRVVLARMLLNVVIDVVGGLVPIVGDAFDVLWRSNTKNLALLERHQNELEPKARPGDIAIISAAAAALVASVALPLWGLAWLIFG